MTAFFTLWRRELAAYFLSPIAYVAICFFLLFMGISFWSLVTQLSNHGAPGVTMMNLLFGYSPFFWIAMLMVVPLISMRLFAEEKRSGTIETLMTAPVTDAAVVLAKYFGALAFFVLMWLPTIAFAYVLKKFAAAASVDMGPMMVSYGGAFLLGAFYLSIGILASSITRNQVVAAIICFTLICLSFMIGFIPYYAQSSWLQHVAGYFSSVEHMMEFSRGVMDTRPIVLYLSLSALALFATVKIIESRRWR